MLKALPSRSMKLRVLIPENEASVSPPVKKAKEISKLTRFGGRRGISPEKLVSSTINVSVSGKKIK